MYLDAETIIQFGALLGVIATCLGMLWKMFRWIEKQREQDVEIAGLKKEISEIKEEQSIICYALLATLDGLKQLGANGNVSAAHNSLEKHLNKQAHNNNGR